MAHTIEYGGDGPLAIDLITTGLVATGDWWLVELTLDPDTEPSVTGRLIATRPRNDDARLDLCIALVDPADNPTGEERWIPADHISKLLIP